jgi:hypothetical protein
MSDPQKEPRGDQISSHITGNVSGQVATGKHIQITRIEGTPVPINEDEQKQIDELRQLLAELRTEIAASAPEEKRAEAIQQVEQIEETIASEEPDASRLLQIQGWFARHLPKLLGAVTSVVVHPLVGRIVEATGDLATAEIRRRIRQGD